MSTFCNPTLLVCINSRARLVIWYSSSKRQQPSFNSFWENGAKLQNMEWSLIEKAFCHFQPTRQTAPRLTHGLYQASQSSNWKPQEKNSYIIAHTAHSFSKTSRKTWYTLKICIHVNRRNQLTPWQACKAPWYRLLPCSIGQTQYSAQPRPAFIIYPLINPFGISIKIDVEPSN